MSDTEAAETAVTIPRVPLHRLLRMQLRLFSRNVGALIGGVFMLILLITAVLSPLLITSDPNAFGLNALSGISLAHPMGTDQYGRDILIRIVVGGRSTLFTSLIAVAIGGIIGSLIGMIAGYATGWVDGILGLVTDIMLALPGLILILMVVAILGPGPVNVQIAVGISLIPVYSRLVRATVLELRTLPYVEAARALGCSPLRIMGQHLLPNLIMPLLVLSSTAIGWAIASGAAVNYLGLGVQLPNADWGLDLAQSVNYLAVAWWVMFPGLMIMLSILAVNLIGDGMQLAFDPKLRQRV
jgi:ABC-type dipeptide/oligopeptide/nickel transport system permease subunit